jgi:hypothetical protein
LLLTGIGDCAKGTTVEVLCRELNINVQYFSGEDAWEVETSSHSTTSYSHFARNQRNAALSMAIHFLSLTASDGDKRVVADLLDDGNGSRRRQNNFEEHAMRSQYPSLAVTKSCVETAAMAARMPARK